MKTDMDPREDMLRAYAEAAKTGVHHPQSAAVAIAWAVGEIDRLRGPLRCTCDYAGQPGEPHKPFCEQEHGPHAECATRAEVTEELGDTLATAAATLLAHTATLAPVELLHDLDRAVRAWKEGRR